MPWLKFLQGWLFSALVGITLLTGIAHLLWGGIRPQAPAWSERVTPATRAHLSVLLGLIMLAKAWGYYLGRFDLLTSTRGVVQGASYTDVHAQLPALNFLMIAALICAVLFLVNIRVRVWSLPVIAVALLAFVSVLAGHGVPGVRAAVPRGAAGVPARAAVHRRQHRGHAAARSRSEDDDVTIPPDATLRDARDGLRHQGQPGHVRQHPPVASVRRSWENFQSLQRIRSYYEFRDVDVDRYTLDGERRVLMMSGREVSQAGIQVDAQTWQNEHLVYTHGYGAVSALVNQATAEGAPA